MSAFGKFVRRAAFAAAATLATPAFDNAAHAQQAATVQNLTPEARQGLLRQYGRVVQTALLTIGRHLMTEERTPGAAKKNLKESTEILQGAMMLYRTLQQGAFLPGVTVDGKFGPKTATLAVRIAAMEQMADVFFAHDTSLGADDQAGYAAIREHLAKLSPVVYAAEIRQIIDAQNMLIDRLSVANIRALARAFMECSSRDRRSYAAEVISAEEAKLKADPSYVSTLIDQVCADILTHVPPQPRGRIQTEFLRSRPIIEEDRNGNWCMMRERHNCLEAKV